MQIVHEGHAGHEQRADQPAQGARGQASAGGVPEAQADEKAEHDDQSATAWGWPRMRAALVWNVQRPRRRPAQVQPGAHERGRKRYDQRREHVRSVHGDATRQASYANATANSSEPTEAI